MKRLIVSILFVLAWASIAGAGITESWEKIGKDEFLLKFDCTADETGTFPSKTSIQSLVGTPTLITISSGDPAPENYSVSLMDDHGIEILSLSNLGAEPVQILPKVAGVTGYNRGSKKLGHRITCPLTIAVGDNAVASAKTTICVYILRRY